MAKKAVGQMTLTYGSAYQFEYRNFAGLSESRIGNSPFEIKNWESLDTIILKWIVDLYNFSCHFFIYPRTIFLSTQKKVRWIPEKKLWMELHSESDYLSCG